MTTTSSVSSQDAASVYAQLNSTGAGAGSAASTADAASDRFLKLLVTQMQNQDPLNPMDNAQVTSQMAQINTVSGIDKLNTTISGMTAQFTQLQALQSASLVGSGVLVAGDKLSIQNNTAAGTFDLGGAADSVKVDVLSPSGQVIDSVDMGAQGAGRHDFSWDAAGIDPGAGLRFRVTAKSGTADVTASTLTHDQVDAVSMQNNQLQLDLRSGSTVPYSQIKAVGV